MDMEDNFIEDLINNIEINELLYNKKHKLYYNKLAKIKIWKSIAKKLGKTVEECQGKWKILRERFVKESRKYGSGADPLEPFYSHWPYTQNLLFLREFVQPRNRKTRCLFETDDNDTDPYPRYTEKRKIEKNFNFTDVIDEIKSTNNLFEQLIHNSEKIDIELLETNKILISLEERKTIAIEKIAEKF